MPILLHNTHQVRGPRSQDASDLQQRHSDMLKLGFPQFSMVTPYTPPGSSSTPRTKHRSILVPLCLLYMTFEKHGKVIHQSSLRYNCSLCSRRKLTVTLYNVCLEIIWLCDVIGSRVNFGWWQQCPLQSIDTPFWSYDICLAVLPLFIFIFGVANSCFVSFIFI